MPDRDLPERILEVDRKIKTAAATSDVDGIFDGLMALGRLCNQVREAKRKERLERRRERARRRYATAKALGILPKKKAKLEPEPDYYEAPTSCQCAATRMPPCSWCENWSEDDC